MQMQTEISNCLILFQKPPIVVNLVTVDCSKIEILATAAASKNHYKQVEVLIIDLEKANGTARELQKRTEQLERVNIEIKSRLEETVSLYEQSQRDLRNKQTEFQRVSHELDKTREQKDALGRENKKLGGKIF